MNNEEKIIIGITPGDINGIGPEIILKAFDDARMLEMMTPVIYASPKVLDFYRKALDMGPVRDMPQPAVITSAEDIDPVRINIIDPWSDELTPQPGNPSEDTGAAAAAALERAATDLREGLIDALVTAPIDKAVTHSEAFPFPGHTDWLQARFAEPGRDKALMVLASDDMRVALVTTHIPLKDVATTLTEDLIAEKLELFDRALREDFGVHKPRIAVLALNPHAGDEGLLGSEESEVIRPAVERVNKEGILAFGPYSPDGFFGSGAFRKFDGVLAMYHDQGLAPFKTLAMSAGVNVTCGLPVVRTSPDHGTAFDIAGRGEAEADSMRSAIYAAIDIAVNRMRHREHHANPLKKQMPDKPKKQPQQPKREKEKESPETNQQPEQ